MKRKIKELSFLLIGILIGSLIPMGSMLGDEAIKLIVNGTEINSDVPPQVILGRTMVPARALCEALGAEVTWNAESNAVVVTDKQVNKTTPTDLPSTTTNTTNTVTEDNTTVKTPSVGHPSPEPYVVNSIGETTYVKNGEKYDDDGKAKIFSDFRKENQLAIVTISVTNQYGKDRVYPHVEAIYDNNKKCIANIISKQLLVDKRRVPANSTMPLIYAAEIPNAVTVTEWKVSW